MFIKQISTKFDKKVTIVKQYIGRRNITHTKKPQTYSELLSMHKDILSYIATW